jgi:hypothetical protein
MRKISNATIFTTGTHNGRSFAVEDLDEISRSFALLGLTGRIPLKSGHDDASQYALGWVTAVRRDGNRLTADLEVSDATARLIEDGALRFMSVELLHDVTDERGRRHTWVLDAVALLGRDRPAVDDVSDLSALVASRPRPDLTFESRATFTLADPDAAADELLTLRETLRETQRQAVDLFIESQVASGRILPRDRLLFERRYPHADIAEARRFVEETPAPVAHQHRAITLEERREGGVSIVEDPSRAAAAFARDVAAGRAAFVTQGPNLSRPRALMPHEVPRDPDGKVERWFEIMQARLHQFAVDPAAGRRWQDENGSL